MALIPRRTALAGLGALTTAALLPAPVAWAKTGTRHFKMSISNIHVGEQRISAKLTPSGLEATIEIDLAARVLGITVWRYSLRAQELWRGGDLISLRSRTDENGRKKFANVKRVRGGVEVKGNKFKGFVKGSPATSTYWNVAFMKRPIWINAQNGRPHDVDAKLAGKALFPTPLGKIESTVWKTAGKENKLNLRIYFDQSDECVGAQFDVRGRLATVAVTEMGNNFSELWDQS